VTLTKNLAFTVFGAYVAFAMTRHVASFWLALPAGILLSRMLALPYLRVLQRFLGLNCETIKILHLLLF